MRRYKSCIVCNSNENLLKFKDFVVCEKCTLKKLYDFKRNTKSSVCEKYKDRVLE